MRLVRYDQLFPMITAMLPGGVEEVMLRQAVRKAGRDFCQKTLVWRDWLNVLNIVAAQDEYVVASDQQVEILQIEEVWLATAEDVTNGDKGAQQDLTECKYDPSTLTLTLPYEPSVAVTSGLNVKAILVPTWQGDEIGDWILAKYGEGIVAGAVAYLAGMKGKPHADGDVKAASMIEFREYCAKAMLDSATGHKEVQVQMGSGSGGPWR